LMLRVRPGVELVFAILLPTSELITLDLPTLDRPRKAISGSTGAGKWPTSVAAVINRLKTRIRQCAILWCKVASVEVTLQGSASSSLPIGLQPAQRNSHFAIPTEGGIRFFRTSGRLLAAEKRAFSPFSSLRNRDKMPLAFGVGAPRAKTGAV
jgi:hypothetical protein